MAKPSTMALLIQAQRKIASLMEQMDLLKAFTVQQCEDMALITLNQDFEFGPGRGREFRACFRETFMSYAVACLEDALPDKDRGTTGDETLTYTKAKLDENLARALGDDMLPFDERYDLEHLYFRADADKKLEEQRNGSKS